MKNTLLAVLLASISVPSLATTPYDVDKAQTSQRLKTATVILSLMSRECNSILSSRDAKAYRGRVKSLASYMDAARSQQQLVRVELGRLAPTSQTAEDTRKDAQAWLDATKKGVLCIDRMTEDGKRPMDPGQADPRFDSVYSELVDKTFASLQTADMVYGKGFAQPAAEELLKRLIKP